MKDDIRKYARIGLVHHMLFPDSHLDAAKHAETLAAFAARTDIETFDCCLPYAEEFRKQMVPAVRDCGKTVCFAIHFFPLRLLPLAAKTPVAKAQTWMLIDDMIEQAVSIGAEGFIFGSGIPPFFDAKADDFAAFDDFCLELCEKLAPHRISAMLEPFDMDVDKKFLYGPIDDCVKLAERITKHYSNFGFELDMAHLPLMREGFASAIERTAPFLKRVHLGNCVLKDRSNPRWGDTHPPMGFPGGEIDVPECAEILNALYETGFLSETKRGNLVVEMTPFPGRSVDFTVADCFERLNKAWELV